MDLYVDGVEPPHQPPKDAIHMCGICYMAKSHPVTYVRPVQYAEKSDAAYQEHVRPQLLLHLYEVVVGE